ncbi:MAG: hypothetical protein JW852_00825, partial [Spirochaetales bacterium]|nr:hypothetical protein [Spirochaetales bacterium]
LHRRRYLSDTVDRKVNKPERFMRIREKVISLVFLAALLSTPAGSQEVPAPVGFAGIEMGMELEAVKDMLRRDSQFRFRGDPDVSMLARPNESLIETEGTSFIERAYFQFFEGKLYTIILALNPERLDHYTMYSQLVDRYGEPASLDPTQVVWEFDSIRMVLERPLSVKYIDTLVFDEILRQNARAESLNALSRERFLEQF